MNEIRVSTTYDEQVCRSLVYLMLCRLRKWPRYALLTLGLGTAVLAGMIMLSEGHVSALPFLVMIIGSMLCTVALCLPQIASRMLIASYGKSFPTFEYTFGGEEITVRTGEREQHYSYGYVLRLLEMSGLLFMFMRDGQMYILRQSDAGNRYGELKNLFESRVSRG